VIARTSDPGAALRLLAEPTRLRILAVLEREELAVGELSRALGLSQSRVSNHLRVLRDAGLLRERHVGTSCFLRMAAPGSDDVSGRLWGVLRDELGGLPQYDADQVRLQTVLAEREGATEFFDRLAGEWDKIGEAFQSGQARERAVGHLLPAEKTYADLGCGTGYMGASLLGRCDRLVCVDRSPKMLAAARERLAANARGTELDFRQGEFEELPIADEELDGLIAGMVLHHLADLERGVTEMARTLKPGSAAAVLELAPHRETWMRRDFGDRHLGLASEDVLAAFRRAGFVDLLLDPVEDAYRPRRSDDPDGAPPELRLYIVRGRKPDPVRRTSTTGNR